jgi:hypothetical protein
LNGRALTVLVKSVIRREFGGGGRARSGRAGDGGTEEQRRLDGESPPMWCRRMGRTASLPTRRMADADEVRSQAARGARGKGLETSGKRRSGLLMGHAKLRVWRPAVRHRQCLRAGLETRL